MSWTSCNGRDPGGSPLPFARSFERSDEPGSRRRGRRRVPGPGARSPVSIVIPAFGAAAQLRTASTASSRHAPTGCEVLVADDATPTTPSREVATTFQSTLSLTYVRRREQPGIRRELQRSHPRRFCRAATTSCCSTPTPGSPRAFSRRCGRSCICTRNMASSRPRSNNATIFSVPVSERLRA